MAEQLNFGSLGEVLDHFEKTGKTAEDAIRVYRSQVKELTGHDTTQPVTPLDVVKIVQRVFFGGANGGLGDARPSGDPGRDGTLGKDALASQGAIDVAASSGVSADEISAEVCPAKAHRQQRRGARAKGTRAAEAGGG